MEGTPNAEPSVTVEGCETNTDDIKASAPLMDVEAVVNAYRAFLADMTAFDAFDGSFVLEIKTLVSLDRYDIVDMNIYKCKLQWYIFLLYRTYHKNSGVNFRAYNYDKVHDKSRAYGNVLLFLPHNNPNVKMPLTYADGHAKAMNVLKSYSFRSEKGIWPNQLLTTNKWSLAALSIDLLCCIAKTDILTYNLMHDAMLQPTYRSVKESPLRHLLLYFGLYIKEENELGIVIDKSE